MNLQQIIEGPSRITNVFGDTVELLRVFPRAPRDMRKVRIEATLMTTTRKFLYPWHADQVLESWDMTATLELKDGRKFTSTKTIRMSFERGLELVGMEVIHAATIDNLRQIRQRAAAM